MAQNMSKKKEKLARNAKLNNKSVMSMDQRFLFIGIAFVIITVLAFKGVLQHNERAANMGKGGRSSSRGPNVLPVVEITDTEALKKVFLSGEPHVVHCVSDATLDSGTPQSVNELHSSGGIEGVKFAFVNCWKATESGKTLSQRFNLPRFDPVTITVANTLPAKVLKTNQAAELLKEQIQKNIVPEVLQIKSLQAWNKHCRTRNRCIVISGKKGAERKIGVEKIVPWMEKHRTLRVVNLDTGFWQVKLEESVLNTRPTRSAEEKFVADAICISRSEKGEVYAKFMQSWEEEVGTAFLAECDKGGDETWPDQMYSVDIIARETLKTKKPVIIEAGKTEETKKRDHVPTREFLETDFDKMEEGPFTAEEHDADDEEEEVEI